MATLKSRIEDHIQVLEKFEARYGEFLTARHNQAADGERIWSGEEWARRERELRLLAPQAEAAMVAAGARRWDEGPVRIDLPARILRFVDEGDGVTDDTQQRRILEEMPTHIGSLQGKLRQADDPRRSARPREIGDRFGDLAQRQADPDGFWEMSETQLVEWLGANNAQPGSPVYKRAKLILEQKRREADRSHRQLEEHRRKQEQSGTTLQDFLRVPDAEKEKVNGKFIGLLALIVAVGALVGIVVPGTPARVVVGAIVVLVVAALVVPSVRRPVSRWLDRNLG